eukprot:NODE_4528_length_665_cov_274.057377.p2 GENE.NODE_4528_length_665_cov_274.057377~~NODE_4528_length_665_cov_274.057377.p2  ORF type:complete len:114 (-),score=34.46 NODE_4528_length_665_cov_274.057377:157-498(-)
MAGATVQPLDPSNVTYQFKGEDHTLGNALRYMLMKHPNIEFAGYTVPHPSEPSMNVRVQTHSSATADETMIEALDNIINVCDHVSKTYRRACGRFEKQRPAEKDASQGTMEVG